MLNKDQDQGPEETQLENIRNLDLNDHSESVWSSLPGRVPPSKNDAIAYCKFYSPWNPPAKWFGKIATDLYATGLRFVMDSIDLTNVGYDGSHETTQFWSVDSPGEFYQDGHWAAWTKTADVSGYSEVLRAD
jgi:hypothetical protein